MVVMAKDGYKEGLQQFQGLVGGRSRLTGRALRLLLLVVGTKGLDKAWMKLSLGKEVELVLSELTLRFNQGKYLFSLFPLFSSLCA